MREFGYLKAGTRLVFQSGESDHLYSTAKAIIVPYRQAQCPLKSATPSEEAEGMLEF